MRIYLGSSAGLVPEEELDSPKIPCKHCQMARERMPPRMEGRILYAQPCHLVLKPGLDGMDIDAVRLTRSVVQRL